MNRTYSLFDKLTGEFTGLVVSIPEHTLARHLRPGIGAKQGRHDCRRSRVDLATGAVVKWVMPRPPDTERDTFDLVAGVWVASPTALALWDQVRAERDRRLAATDWRVTVAAERGESVPSEWQAYRQALRDVTGQADPRSVVWPEPPA